MKKLFDRHLVEELNGSLVVAVDHVALTLPAGDILVFVDPGVPLPDALTGVVASRTLDILKISNAVAQTNNDPNLSPAGKSNRRAALEIERAKVSAKLEGAARYIEDLNLLALLAEDNLYDPPELDATDVVSALADTEIRTWFASQPIEALGGALNERQLFAMKRSPVPLGQALGDIVESAWEQYLVTKRAKEFKAVQEDRAVATWAMNALAQLRGSLERLTFYDVADALPAMQAQKVIRPAPESRAA